jgi:hypothetical protein
MYQSQPLFFGQHCALPLCITIVMFGSSLVDMGCRRGGGFTVGGGALTSRLVRMYKTRSPEGALLRLLVRIRD